MTFSFENFEYDETNLIDRSIDESGAYVGEFLQVAVLCSKNTGTHGLRFEFAADEGGIVKIDIYVQKADGTKLFGADTVGAVKKVLGLSRFEVVEENIEKYDFEKKEKVLEMGKVVKNLENKKIGLVLRKKIEDHMTKPGEVRISYEIVEVFHPISRLTAGELAAGVKEAKKLDKRLKSLKDKDVRKVSSVSAASALSLPDEVDF